MPFGALSRFLRGDMKLKELKWKESKLQYGHGHNLYVGKIKVGGYTYDGIDRNNSWVGHIALPGFKRDLRIKGNDENKIRAEMEQLVLSWFDKVLDKGE